MKRDYWHTNKIPGETTCSFCNKRIHQYVDFENNEYCYCCFQKIPLWKILKNF